MEEETQDLNTLLNNLTEEDSIENNPSVLKGLFDSFFNATIIKINYHNSPYTLQMTDIGDWCDLYLAEDITLKKDDFKYLSMGVSMELPDKYEAIMAPRSSTFAKWGILQTNGIGVIDNSYNGDDDIWMMPCYATRDVEIPAGTRLCQFRIQEKQPSLKFAAVKSLGNDARGGLGSTGD